MVSIGKFKFKRRKPSARTKTNMPGGVMWLYMVFVDMLGMEMHTNTLVRVFVGRGKGGGWD